MEKKCSIFSSLILDKRYDALKDTFPQSIATLFIIVRNGLVHTNSYRIKTTNIDDSHVLKNIHFVQKILIDNTGLQSLHRLYYDERTKNAHR
jgi:hypothetical protein